MIVVNLLHIAIAIPLIYGHWGLPALGINGAAIAVGIAEATGCLYLFTRCRPMLGGSHRFRFDLIRTIWHVGAPVSGERVVQQAGILLYTKIVLMYGTVAYAAHQVGLSIESLSFLPGYGFAIAAATMVGQSIGAGKYTRRSSKPGKQTGWPPTCDVGHGVVFFLFPRVAPRLHQ